MRAYERFLEYVKVDTTSDPANPEGRPSTKKQFDLARMLEAEMKKLGMDGVWLDAEHCCVYGFVPASPGCEGAAALGLIAHMDTAPDASGADVRPVIHPAYDGGDVALPSGRILDAGLYTELATLAGQTLITASGNTLLGADDKAGIAEILTACERLLKGEKPHGKICVAFTPDEEIGGGARDLDLDRLGADFAYTVDGGAPEEFEYETFNAAAAKLTFNGVAVHPGSAKGVMVNAIGVAADLHALLPKDQRAETTEGRQGFIQLMDMAGNVEKATSEYIIRDHDREKFEAKKDLMRDAAKQMQAQYGPNSVELEIADSYYNMGEIIEQNMHLVENAKQAITAVGLAPRVQPVRGGTDGSQLSFRGLPCPNLGTGGHYFHGPAECITAEAMDQVVEILLNLAGLYAKPGVGKA